MKDDSYTSMPAFTACALFAGIRPPQYGEMLEILEAKERHYRKGQFLKAPGTVLHAMGLVLSGSVQVYTDDRNGHHMLVMSASAGDTFGEALCCHGEAEAEDETYIRAGKNSRVVWMRMDALLHPYSTVPPSPDRQQLTDLLRINLICMMAKTISQQKERVFVFSQPTLRRKILLFLSQLETKYDSRYFQIPYDRSDMAAYLGVNRSALSRELSAMKEEGLIDFHKNSFRLYTSMPFSEEMEAETKKD